MKCLHKEGEENAKLVLPILCASRRDSKPGANSTPPHAPDPQHKGCWGRGHRSGDKEEQKQDWDEGVGMGGLESPRRVRRHGV